MVTLNHQCKDFFCLRDLETFESPQKRLNGSANTNIAKIIPTHTTHRYWPLLFSYIGFIQVSVKC